MKQRVNPIPRLLRRRQTSSEKLLWKELRNRKMDGFKFLRQHPIYYWDGRIQKFFVADFYCSEKKLVVELDGEIHLTQIEYDEWRDEILNSLELRVLRIKNEELGNMKEVLNKIHKYMLI